MSLNWSVKDVVDHDKICFLHYEEDGEPRRRLNQTTQNLIFLTMVIGIGQITAENVEETFKRIALYERLWGAYGQIETDTGFEDDPYTIEDIRQHVGLYTNVSFEKPAAWRKRILESFERELIKK